MDFMEARDGGAIDGNSGAQQEQWSQATSPENSSLSKREAQRRAWKDLLAEMQQNSLEQNSRMTVAEFVERRFVPDHVAQKRVSGRTHYRSLLKHVVTPELVDRLFDLTQDNGKTKLKAHPGWPYMDSMRLCDVLPAHIRELTSAALAQGYSTQTVMHIRNVVSSIFSHAKREQCFEGENPASLVNVPRVVRRQPYALTAVQVGLLLKAMKSPEREISLLILSTGMTVAEVCALQWKHVNLSAEPRAAEGEPLAARSIAVRQQWRRGALQPVKRSRDLRIPDPIYPLLARLRRRPRFTDVQDYVIPSRAGTPLLQTNLVARRLKPLARRLGLPWLSWNVLLRTRVALSAEFGRGLQEWLGKAFL